MDAYCEGTGPDDWSEPINAMTNLAFLIAALVLWPRLRGPEMAMGRALAAVLFVIGVGSRLFHTHANRLTGLMDVLPILGFILLYVFAATRDYWAEPRTAQEADGLASLLNCKSGSPAGVAWTVGNNTHAIAPRSHAVTSRPAHSPRAGWVRLCVGCGGWQHLLS